MLQATQINQETPVKLVINTLEDNITSLEGLVSTLISRLHPVTLSYPVETVQSNPELTKNNCLLVNQIDDQLTRICQLRVNLGRTLENLQI